MTQRTIKQPTPWINLEAIAPFLPRNPVIIEAGAHNGKGTLKLKKQWPESTIHAFEPLPWLYQELIERTKKSPHVYCYNVALSDTNGRADMHVSSGRTDACSSLLAPHQNLTIGRSDIIFKETLTVPTVTLDTWAQHNAITYVDFLWLDLQGAELKVLQGAQTLLNRVHVIHSEINEIERYINSVLYKELKIFLENKGFYPYIKAINSYGWGNALFVKTP